MRSTTVILLTLLLATGCGPDYPQPATEPDLAPVDTLPAADLPTEPADRFSVLYDDDQHHLFAVSRPFAQQMLVIVVNWSDEAHGLRIPKPLPAHYDLLQATTDESYRVQNDETGIILEIGARTVMVLGEVPMPADY